VAEVIIVTSCADTGWIIRAGPGPGLLAGCSEIPGLAGLLAPERPWRGPAARFSSEGKFDRFLPFGLTLSPSRPTVTVRNHLLNREQARGPRNMPSEYAKTLGARLRAIRTQQGLSLHGVEEKSRGRWKAVVVGSYERGDRSVTVQKLAELAEFYGVPVSELLPGDVLPALLAPSPKLVIDLERMSQLPKDKAGPLARYVATIQSQRGDYNGRVLSIRQEDLRSLAVIYDKSPSDLTEELISWGILDADARGAIETF
jgi:transcriptional regulator with XRE-family HTH domain